MTGAGQTIGAGSRLGVVEGVPTVVEHLPRIALHAGAEAVTFPPTTWLAIGAVAGLWGGVLSVLPMWQLRHGDVPAALLLSRITRQNVVAVSDRAAYLGAVVLGTLVASLASLAVALAVGLQPRHLLGDLLTVQALAAGAIATLVFLAISVPIGRAARDDQVGAIRSDWSVVCAIYGVAVTAAGAAMSVGLTGP